jgi:hypothetical protein
MSKVYAKIDGDWCNLCSGKGNIKLSDGTWRQLKPLVDDVKYYNGEDWKDLDCCYPTDVDIPESLPAPLDTNLGYYKNIDPVLAFPGLDFMDDLRNIPTCQELKNICCDIDGATFEEAATEYRANRDAYLKAILENILAETVGSLGSIVTPEPVDTTQWEAGGLGDKIVYGKGGLVKINVVQGCAECTYQYWKDTIAPILPTVTSTMEWLPAITDPLQPLPVGEPGQLIKYPDVDNPGGYLELAWNPQTNSWSTSLYAMLEDIFTTNRVKRDNWLKELNGLVLATRPFLWANDYMPNHRWKIEEI